MSAPRDEGRGLWNRFAKAPTTHFTPWKFNWLANHRLLAAIDRVRDRASGALLDVGCGSKPFARRFEGRVRRYWATDLPGSRDLGEDPPDAFATAEAQPFRDGTFDTVLGVSMLCYLREPASMITEAYRVLRPGGTLILEFTQMAPLYNAPYDYFRFTRFGAEYLLRSAGFEVVEVVPIGGLWARVGLSAIAALRRVNRGPWRVLTELPVRVLYVVLQLVFDGLDRLFHDPGEVLANLVVARKPV